MRVLTDGIDMHRLTWKPSYHLQEGEKEGRKESQNFLNLCGRFETPGKVLNVVILLLESSSLSVVLFLCKYLIGWLVLSWLHQVLQDSKVWSSTCNSEKTSVTKCMQGITSPHLLVRAGLCHPWYFLRVNKWLCFTLFQRSPTGNLLCGLQWPRKHL